MTWSPVLDYTHTGGQYIYIMVGSSKRPVFMPLNHVDIQIKQFKDHPFI